MKQRVAILALALGIGIGIVACGAKQNAVVSIPTVDAGPAPTNGAGAPPRVTAERPCTLDIGAPQTFAIPAGLQAIAPQYFHPGGREGFNDLVQGTKKYRWYDPSDLQHPVDPPGDMDIVVKSTKSFLVGQAGGELRVARRGGRESKRIGQNANLRIVDATEDRLGNAWVIASDVPSNAHATLWVHRVNPDLTWDQTHPLNLGINVFDAVVAVTDDRTVGVIVLDRDANELHLTAYWTAPKQAWQGPEKLDAVTLPPMAVELSVRTTVDLSVAWHGTDMLAVAWRPLAPKDGEIVDAGSKAKPPSKPVTAAVRILLAKGWGNGPVAPPIVHPTVAAPLGGVSGIGPWPLHSNGMRGATLHQQALFAWIDDGIVKVASPGDTTPRTIDNGFPRLVFRPAGNSDDLDLLMLQSSGPQKMVRLGCMP